MKKKTPMWKTRAIGTAIYLPFLKCFEMNVGFLTKKCSPNKNHRVEKVKNVVHKILHEVYDTAIPYEHRGVLIWQVRVGF